jgi:hypothetical protein
MHVLKNILVGLGALFLLILVFFAWIGASSRYFSKEQAAFVEEFVTALSKRWVIADVRDHLADSFVAEAGTPQAQQLLNQFKRLGKLQSVHELELRSYSSTSNGQTGLFSFKGTFEYGEAVVDVTIIKKNGEVRVLSFYLNATQVRDEAPKFQT